MGSEVEVGGFDDIAKRAVEAANAGGLEDEAEEIASKSERIMRPSMAVSMFRGRRHISCNVDPANVAGEDPMEEEEMDIKPLENDAYLLPEETAASIGVDPVMVWKADVMRALRAADDRSMAVSTLAAQAANPEPATAYHQLVQEHLIDRQLAKWVVENETVQLLAT